MASSVVGALRVNLGADTAAFSTGMKKATGELQGFSRAANATSRPTGQFTSRLQNASYQIQDVAVQITGGTEALRAFGQQLPQLLSGFGVFGAIGGTVAAVGLGVASALLSSEKQAATADEAISALAEAMSRAKDAGDLLALSQSDLAQQFGSAALGANIAASQTRDSLAGIVEATRSLGASALAPFNESLGIARDVTASLRQEFVIGVSDVQALGQAFDLPQQQARVLAQEMQNFSNATTAPALSQALLNIYQMLSDWKLEMGQLPPQAEALRLTLSGVVGELGAAIAQTNDLSASLAEAGNQAARLREQRRMQRMEDARANVARDVARDKIADLAKTEDGRTSSDRGTYLTYEDRQGLGRDDRRNPSYSPPKARGGGGGGGRGSAVSDAERELEALRAKAQQVVTATRTPMEAFNLRMVELNQLMKAGVLDWDTYSRAVTDAQDELTKTGEAGAQAFDHIADRAADTISGIIAGTTSIKEAAASMLADFGTSLLRSGIGGLFNKGGGGIFAGIGKAIGIPGFASGTAFAPGGLAWVGERGPEVVNLPRGSRVTPNRQSMAQRTDVRVGVEVLNDGGIRAFVMGENAKTERRAVAGSMSAVQKANRTSRKFLG